MEIDRLQKYAARFASLHPDDFGAKIILALHPNYRGLADHDILAIVERFIGPQPKTPDGYVGYDYIQLIAVRRE